MASSADAWPRPLVATAVFAAALVALPLAHSPEPGVRVERTTLTSPGGERVTALRIEPLGPGRGTALLAHGITASKETLRLHAEGLARAGLRCLVLDLPAHGESATPLTRAAVLDAFAAGAEALSPGDRRVDVLVGHSFGAYNGARAMEGGVLSARLFVAVGARPALGSPNPRDHDSTGPKGRPERALFVSGGLEELHSPAMVRRHAANQGGEAVIVPGVDHAFEPFDPRVVTASTHAACALLGLEEPARSRTWLRRLIGCGLLCACAVLGVRFLPRGGAWVGLVGGGLLVSAAVAGVHGVSLYLAPTPGRLLVAGGVSALAGGASVALTRLLALRRPRSTATAGQLLGLVIAGLLAVALALSGRAFSAMIAMLLCLLLALATAFAWAVRRRAGSEGSAHTAFALVAGYVPGAWFGSLLV